MKTKKCECSCGCDADAVVVSECYEVCEECADYVVNDRGEAVCANHEEDEDEEENEENEENEEDD